MKAYFREIPFDQFTPITAFHALGQSGSCILESSPKVDRFSFIGIDPIAKIQGTDNYDTALREMMQKHPVEIDHPTALYTGAPVGYVTFENEYFFQIYRSAVIFDHEDGKAYLSTIGEKNELDKLENKLKEHILLPNIDIEFGSITAEKTDKEFIEMVQEAKKHLEKGNVYQIVISRKFKMKTDADPFQLYRAIRRSSPAPYQFFFNLEESAIVGASPEKVISVENGLIESIPIAGTCAKEESVDMLLNDPKEMAEHVMLVDLARNDVGAVSIPGTVKVEEFKKVHKFAHITHVISRVTGKLDPQFDALDAFKISFPAGTLSGAPKKRAKELIREIEKEKRGFYGGAVVALDRKGNLSSCIIIRTAILEKGSLTVQSGSGIVLDSIPEKEADESRLKASTILKVVATCC